MYYSIYREGFWQGDYSYISDAHEALCTIATGKLANACDHSAAVMVNSDGRVVVLATCDGCITSNRHVIAGWLANLREPWYV